jgi:WD repeat-containing protein 35
MNLVSTDRKLEAVEFFRCANKPTEAALLISDVAETVATRNVNPLLAKKLHVLSALEVERHRKRIVDQATASSAADGTGGRGGEGGGNVAHTTAATLETLMMTSLEPGGFGAVVSCADSAMFVVDVFVVMLLQHTDSATSISIRCCCARTIWLNEW